MQLKRARLYTRIPQRSELSVWDDLRTDYGGVLNGVKSQFWKQFGLDYGSNGDARPGDIFWADGDVLLYYYVAPGRDYLEAGVVSRTDGQHLYQGFCERIHDSLGLSKEVTWKPYQDTSQTYQVLLEEATRLEVVPEEVESASFLRQDGPRELLRLMHTQGSSFLEALAVGRDMLEVGTLVADLEQHRLLQREYVVVCKKTAHQISRVKNLDEIDAVSRSGFKCPHCGSSYNDERIDQLVACTPMGERMARPNYWLALASLKVMDKLHLPTRHVLHLNEKEFQVLDLFVHLEGDLLMVEPHDAGIRLNDAFMFCARARYYHPKVAILLSAATPSPEVTRYLSQASDEGVRILLAHGVEDMQAQLTKVLNEWQDETLRQTLERFQPGTRVDLGALVSEYFFGPEAAAPPPPVEEIKEQPEDRSMPAAAPEYHPEEVLDKPMEEQHVFEPAATEAPEPLEEEEVQETSALPSMPATEFIEETQPAEMDSEVSEPEDFQEADSGAEFYVEDTIVQEQHTVEDVKEVALKRLIEDLHQHGVAGRVDAIERALSEGNISASLVTDEGLPLASQLDPVLESDLVSALAVDVAETVARGLAEADFKPMSSMMARATPMNYTFHPLPNALLLVHEKRVAEQAEDEPFHMHSEMDLRDAILKQVLVDLSRQDGVQANIVVNREGLVIDHQASPAYEEFVHMWAAVFCQTLSDAERSLLRMQAVPLRQILIWTPDTLVSLIPLDKEGILVSTLDPTAPRDTYAARLLKAATMLTSVFL